MPLAKRSCLLAVLGCVALVSTASGANHVIQIVDNQFVPSSLTIFTNDTVTWRNDGFLQHTSTSGSACASNGKWDSGLMDPGDFFTPGVNPFTATGTYPYFCMIHCLVRMTGTITVQAPPVATEATTWGAVKALFRTATK